MSWERLTQEEYTVWMEAATPNVAVTRILNPGVYIDPMSLAAVERGEAIAPATPSTCTRRANAVRRPAPSEWIQVQDPMEEETPVLPPAEHA